MNKRQAVGLAVLNVLASLLFLWPAVAQDFSNYATGAELETDAQIESFSSAPTRRAFYPPVVDLSNRFPPPGDQGQQGSCVGWAVGYAARSYYNAKSGRGANLPLSQIPSPAYIYNSNANGCCSCGMQIFSALDLLKFKGASSLASYPYNEDICSPPASLERKQANGFRIQDWLALRVPSIVNSARDRDIARLNMVKQELAFGHPVVISLQTTTTFFAGKGVWPGDGDVMCGEKPCGGHALAITGYNDKKRRFKFINSWSRRWGKDGYGWMTYNAYLKRARASYVMRLSFEPELPKPLPTPTPEDFNIVLPDTKCGGIIVGREGRRFKITGFVGEEGDIDLIRKAISQRTDVTLDVELRPWPQCETLLTLKDVLSDKRKPTIKLAKKLYREGETLAFDVKMSAYQGYLHVAYIQADGKVVNLVQSSPRTLRTLAPLTELKFGDGLEGRSKFTVGKPFGNEMIVVIASKSPLFDKRRPKVEIERDFLSALRDAIIARPDANSAERLVTADYYVLQTKRR